MATLDDLRATLEDQAADATGTPPGGGVPRIVARARRMRARRRAAGAGAVAAVTAVVLGVTVLPSASPPDGPQPAAGVVPPATMTSLGSTYAWSESVTGEDGVATVDVEATDGPVLVSWGTSGADDTVRVSTPAEATYVYRTADFAEFTFIPSGAEGEVRVRAAEGEAGLAVYRLSEPAAGVAGGGLLFRDRVGDGRLVAATVGEPGQVTVPLRARPGTRMVGISYACADGPAEAEVGVRILGERGSTVTGAACDGGAQDVGSWTTAFAFPAGEVLRAQATVRVQDGTPGPDMRLGVAVYDLAAPAARVGRRDVAGAVEESGHRWVLDEVRRAPRGSGRLVVEVSPQESGSPVLVQAVTSGRDEPRSLVRTSMGGRGGSSTTMGVGTLGLGQVTRAGTEVVLRIEGEVPDDTRLGLAIYRQPD